MVDLDFKNTPIYKFIIHDNGKIIYKGVLNVKAWNKILETKEIWEYVTENGRVINKKIDNKKVDNNKTTVEQDIVSLFLSDDRSIKKEINISLNDVLNRLETIIKKRKVERPENSYTTNLFDMGQEKFLKKIGEETTELILAAGNNEEIIYEAADLLYHILTFLVYKDIPFEKVLKELRNRMDK